MARRITHNEADIGVHLDRMALENGCSGGDYGLVWPRFTALDGLMKLADLVRRPEQIEFFLRLYGLWEGVIDIQAWTVANAYLKDLTKAKAEYDGKECVIRNLLAYQCVGDARKVSGCAFDPKTKTASISIASRYQGQDLVKGDEFSFEIEFANAAEFDSIKDSSNSTVDGKSTAVFETLFSIQGTILQEDSDNSLIVKKAKLVK